VDLARSQHTCYTANHVSHCESRAKLTRVVQRPELCACLRIAEISGSAQMSYCAGIVPPATLAIEVQVAQYELRMSPPLTCVRPRFHL
jgi:hypothetical protein